MHSRNRQKKKFRRRLEDGRMRNGAKKILLEISKTVNNASLVRTVRGDEE